MPLLFPLFVQRDLRRSHSACQQQPHPKRPSGRRHRSVVESIITQYMIGPMYWRLFQSNTKPAATKEGEAAPLPLKPRPMQTAGGGHSVFLILCAPHARFFLRCSCSRSAIMAMNSELVGLPLAEFTV